MLAVVIVAIGGSGIRSRWLGVVAVVVSGKQRIAASKEQVVATCVFCYLLWLPEQIRTQTKTSAVVLNGLFASLLLVWGLTDCCCCFYWWWRLIACCCCWCSSRQLVVAANNSNSSSYCCCWYSLFFWFKSKEQRTPPPTTTSNRILLLVWRLTDCCCCFYWWWRDMETFIMMIIAKEILQ